jgi:type I restriction enzyme M protein
MPLNADMRRQIDQIRDYLFGGGYPNPMANAEQLSFLFFFYLIEGIDAENAQRAKVLKQPYESVFAGEWELKNPLNEHIIRAIVEMIDPKIGETIYDPAAGTAGFLVAAYNHIRLTNSSPAGIQDVEIDGKIQRRGIGDKLSSAQSSTLQSKTFFGNDVDPQMVRLATMNLTLRGLPNVRILLRNVLTTSLDSEKKAELQLPDEGYHVVLANPPFAGKIDSDRVVDDVKIGNSKATEVLFLKYMMESLRPGGRCGVIVPEGLLFGSTGAHKEIRRQLIENNRVEAVMSLPGGVFQPYSGVKTSVLLFKKGGKTDRVLFLHVDNDGYKLDANHDTPIDADDLAELVAAYRDREAKTAEWTKRDAKAPWHAKWWIADVTEVRTNEFNLSAGRYRPVNASTAVHRDPRELLDELAELEREIAAEVVALREALSDAPV